MDFIHALKVKLHPDGPWINIPAIKGEKGDKGDDNVAILKYRESTYEEAAEALSAGKVLLATGYSSDGGYYMLARQTTTSFVFTSLFPLGNGSRNEVLHLNKDNSWIMGWMSLRDTDDVVKQYGYNNVSGGAVYAELLKKADKTDSYTKTEIDKKIQDAKPTDYETVKAGAAKGATSVQPADIYSKKEIDSKIAQATPSDYATVKAQVAQNAAGVAQIKNVDIPRLEQEIAEATPADYEEVKDQVINNTKVNAQQNRRLTNIEYALDGKAYRTEELADEAYTKDIPSDAMPFGTLDYIGGKSIVFNQLIQTPNVINTVNGVSFTKNSDGSWTANGTATANVAAPLSAFSSIDCISANDKLMVRIPKEASANSVHIEVALKDEQGNFIFDSHIYDETMRILTVSRTAKQLYYAFRISEGYTCNNVVFSPILFNLTKDFGSGNEPTIAECDAIFSKLYYPYTEPTIVNAESKAVVSRGKNLIDKSKIERGFIDNDNGNVLIYSDHVHTDYISVIPNQQYSIINASNGGNWGAWYDADKKFVSGTNSFNSNKTITAPSNAYFYRFTLLNDTYSDTVMFVKGASTIASYTPYREPIIIETSQIIHKYFPNGMKSAGAVHDTFDIENGVAVQNVGEVDLGTIAWTLFPNRPGGEWTSETIQPYFKPVSATRTLSAICDTYIVSSYIDMANHDKGRISGHDNNDKFYCYNGDTVNPPKGFIVYELATPITTPIAAEDLEALRALEVEGGGTLTFENTLDGLHIPILNKETLLIKTGATT